MTLLGDSTVITTMRFAHTDLDSKRDALVKLEETGDSLVTPCTKMHSRVESVTKILAKSSCTIYLETL